VHGNRLESRLVPVLLPVLLAGPAVAALDGHFVVREGEAVGEELGWLVKIVPEKGILEM
jgi:hypothetical protein